MSDIFRISYKIIVLGQGKVGKSSLISRFVHNKFELNTLSSTGMNEFTKIISIDDQNIILHLWDTAGQEAYQSIVPLYFKGCKAAIIVFDITDDISFKRVNYWLSQVKDQAPSDILIMLIGNKSDLEDRRTVNKKLAIDLAKNSNMLYFETSCLTADNVELAFMQLGKKLNENSKIVQQDERFESTAGRKLVMTQESSKKGGCCKGGKGNKR